MLAFFKKRIINFLDNISSFFFIIYRFIWVYGIWGKFINNQTLNFSVFIAYVFLIMQVGPRCITKRVFVNIPDKLFFAYDLIIYKHICIKNDLTKFIWFIKIDEKQVGNFCAGFDFQRTATFFNVKRASQTQLARFTNIYKI